MLKYICDICGGPAKKFYRYTWSKKKVSVRIVAHEKDSKLEKPHVCKACLIAKVTEDA